MGAAPVDVDDRWAETDFGVAEGLTYDELVIAAPGIAERLVAGAVDIDWPAGERAAVLAGRVADAWQDVVRTQDATTIVVTHGGPIRVAVALATGRVPADVPLPEPAGTVRLARTGRDDLWRVVGRP
jgi:probable phosphoglycerate mutase